MTVAPESKVVGLLLVRSRRLHAHDCLFEHFVICRDILARLLNAGMVHEGLQAHDVNASPNTVGGE